MERGAGVLWELSLQTLTSSDTHTHHHTHTNTHTHTPIAAIIHKQHVQTAWWVLGNWVKTKDIILITDWKSIVFRRMAILLIFSVLLFLFVVGLLYYSIKNLITQKKITVIILS